MTQMISLVIKAGIFTVNGGREHMKLTAMSHGAG